MMSVGNMTLSSFLVRAAIFAMPGLLLIAGGPSPAMPNADPPIGLGGAFAQTLTPCNWYKLLLCAGLICLPGLASYLLSDFLAEIKYARLHALRRTPGIVWIALGYVLAMGLSVLALIRAVHLWTA